MKPNAEKAGKKLSREFSIEFFENIPSTVSLIDRFKIEERKMTEKLRVFNSKKAVPNQQVTLKLGVTEHISSHRNLL